MWRKHSEVKGVECSLEAGQLNSGRKVQSPDICGTAREAPGGVAKPVQEEWQPGTLAVGLQVCPLPTEGVARCYIWGGGGRACQDGPGIASESSPGEAF